MRHSQVRVAAFHTGTGGGILDVESGFEAWVRSAKSEKPSPSLSARTGFEGNGFAFTSSPSLRPSASLSGFFGEVPRVSSAPSARPSWSVSGWRGSVPAAISAALFIPSKSASEVASATAGLNRFSTSTASGMPSLSVSVAVLMIWMPCIATMS